MGIEPGWVKKNESTTFVILTDIFSSSSSSRLQIQSILQTTKRIANNETRILNDGSRKKTPTSDFCNLPTTLISIPIPTNYYFSPWLPLCRCVSRGETG